MLQVPRDSRRTLSQFWSFKICRTMFQNYRKSSDVLFLRLLNCEISGRVESLVPFKMASIYRVTQKNRYRNKLWFRNEEIIFGALICQKLGRASLKETTLERADFTLQLFMFVTTEKERRMFTIFFLSSICQLLSPWFFARIG